MWQTIAQCRSLFVFLGVYRLDRAKIKLKIGSFVAGFLNGVFGVGGGILFVPLLENLKIKSKSAHATSVAAIALFCVVSFLGYCFHGYFDFFESLKFVPAGLAGALVGSLTMCKINSVSLRWIFAIVLIVFSVRLFLL